MRRKLHVRFGEGLLEKCLTGQLAGRLLYYCSTRISMSSSMKMTDEFKNIVGVQTNFTNTKSRFCPPHKKARSVPLYFASGIHPFGGLLELLLQQRRIEMKTAGNYAVLDPYADGKEIKFKSSAERNDVPPEVLLKCPALVDATCEDDIKYYIDLASGVNEAETSVANVEAVEEEL